MGETLVALAAVAPLDLRALLTVVTLLAQAYVRAQANAAAWLARTGDVAALDLPRQEALGAALVAWRRLGGLFGLFAYTHRFEHLDTVLGQVPLVAGGANARGVATGMTLEALLSPPTVSSVSVESFWLATTAGRASLGRLLAMDVALETEYDFSPVEEAELILADALIPLAPPPEPILAALAASSTSRIAQQVPAVRAVEVTQGATLAMIALAALGDAGAWPVIAQYNNLAYPYLSGDPAAKLGPLQATRILVAPVAQGATSVTLLNTQGLYRDQRLWLSDPVTGSDALTITSVDTETGIVSTADATTRAYDVSTPVAIYPPVYDVVGTVLAPGETILVPLPADAHRDSVTRPPGTRVSAVAIYGVDLAVMQGRLTVTAAGALETVAGTANLKQAIAHKFMVDRGALPYWPLYGTGLRAFLTHKNEPFFGFLATVDARQTILRDPRIERVENPQAALTGDTVTLDATAITTLNETFPATRVLIPLRSGV
jgi:hypothetical protein